jgi:hypothetical protein
VNLAPPQSRRILAIVLVVTAAALGAGLAVFLRPRVQRSIARAMASQRGQPTKETAATASQGDDALDLDQTVAKLRNAFAEGATLEEVAPELSRLGRNDPGRALAIASRLGREPEETRLLIAPIVHDWAKRDPTAAWHWTVEAGTAFDVPGQLPLPAAVVVDIAATQPAEVSGLVGELLDNDAPPQALNVSAIAEEGIAALVRNGSTGEAWAAIEQWSGSPRAQLLGREPYERIALAAAQSSPAAAAAHLQELPPLPGRNFALAEVASEWANRDPRAALAWTEQLDAGDAREDVMCAAFGRWEQKDLTGAAEWLAPRADTAAYDRLIAEVVSDPRAVQTNLRATLSLVENITGPRLREQSLESVARRWAETDITSATQYITANARLSSDEKLRLLKALQPPDDDPEW